MSWGIFDDDPHLAAVPPNPYVFGGVVAEPPGFVDRVAELRQLAAAVRAASGGVLLVRGDFRIGKSSILARLAREIEALDDARRIDRAGRRLVVHSFTCQQLTFGRAPTFVSKLCTLLGGTPADDPAAQIEELSALLTGHAARGVHPIFLVDELGDLPRVNGAPTLVRLVRGLVADYPVHFVFAGPFSFHHPRMPWPTGEAAAGLRHDLDRLDQVTETIDVGPLSIAHAVEVIRLSELLQPSTSLRGFEELLLELAGTIPYMLQVACSQLYELLYEDLRTRLDDRELEERRRYLATTPRPVELADSSEAYLAGEPDALSDDRLNVLKRGVYDQLADGYFAPLWHGLLDEEERAALIGVEGGIAADEISWSSPQFRLLQRGYLRRRGARLWIFSSLFEEHVRRHHAPQRPRRTPSTVSLRLAEVRADELGSSGLLPADFVASLCGFAARCGDLSDREPSLEDAQEFMELFAHLVALLSQLAVVTYAAQPAIQQAELNNTLRQNRFRDPSLGSRLDNLRRILRSDRLDEHDVLGGLRESLCRQRDGEDLAHGLRLVREVRGSRRTRLSLLDVLDACVQLRNLHAHPENRPPGTTAGGIRRLIPLAAAALDELVTALIADTRRHTVVALATPAEAGIPLTALFDASRRRALARLSGHEGAQEAPRAGEMYSLRYDSSATGEDTVFLHTTSLFPLLVDGATLAAACPDVEPSLAPDAVYVLIGSRRTGLRFAPLGHPNGARIEVRQGEDHRHLLEGYEAVFERLR